jgi:death-on-curing protein
VAYGTRRPVSHILTYISTSVSQYDGIVVDVFAIEHFLAAAESVLEIDADRLARVTNIPLAESALAAPFAGVGDVQFYEHPVHCAAVLASRILRNHPLPDGNKRVALILMDLYLEENGLRLTASPQEINVMFRAVAARRKTEDCFMDWLFSHTESLKEGA